MDVVDAIKGKLAGLLIAPLRARTGKGLCCFMGVTIILASASPSVRAQKIMFANEAAAYTACMADAKAIAQDRSGHPFMATGYRCKNKDEIHRPRGMMSQIYSRDSIGGFNEYRWFSFHSFNWPAEIDEGQSAGAPICNAGPTHHGNPINVTYGNKYQVETDLSYGRGLELKRHYNSRFVHSGSGALGKGWVHEFDAKVEFASDAMTAEALRPDGKIIMFFLLDNGEWSARRGGTAYRLERLRDISGNDKGWRLSTSRPEGIEEYDNSGRLVGKEIGMPDELRLTYRTDGRLGYVSRSDGRGLIFEYGSDGRLFEVIGPDGVGARYGYTTNGVLSSVGIAESYVKGYSYDQDAAGEPNPHRLAGVFDETGAKFATFAYDKKGRAVLSEHAEGAGRVRISYDGIYAEVMTPSGSTYRVQVRQTATGKVDRTLEYCQGCEARETSYAYTGDGILLSKKENGVLTEYSVDDCQFETLRVEAKGTSVQRMTESDRHSEWSLPTETRLLDGQGVIRRVQRYAYNERGQLILLETRDATKGQTRSTAFTHCRTADVESGICPRAGLLLKTDGPRTDVDDSFSYDYYTSDDAGCGSSFAACEWRKGDLRRVVNPLGHTLEFIRYDEGGRPLSLKDSNGVTVDLEYHPRGWISARKVRGDDDSTDSDDQIYRFDYHPTGLIRSVTLPGGRSTSFIYDAAQRLTEVIDTDGNSTRYTLDLAGNSIKEVVYGSNGTIRRTLSRIYNQFGEMQSERGGSGATTRFSYNSSGDLKAVTDALGRTTDNEYDPLRRLTRIIKDRGGISAGTQLDYDVMDRLVEVVDPKGLETSYQYNVFDDLTGLASPDTGTSTYVYDNAGNRTSATDARGVTTTYEFDALNRARSITYADASLNVAYVYDTPAASCPPGERFSVGRLSEAWHANGSTAYCHDRFGKVVRKIQTTGGVTSVLRYDYDRGGNLSGITYPDGSVVEYALDGQGRVREISLVRPDLVRHVLVSQVSRAPFGGITGWTYGNGRTLARTFDLDYRPLAIHDSSAGGLSLGFGYDPVGSIVELKSGDGATAAAKYAYDGIGRLVETQDGASGTPIERYTYDATGNRTSLKTASGTTDYVYPLSSHHLTAVGGEKRSYDAAGNTLQIGDREYVYNAANRMSAVAVAGRTLEAYTYNHFGERVWRESLAGTAISLFDEDGQWVGDYSAAGEPIQQAIWLENYPVALIGDHGVAYVQPDHLGTPRVIVDPLRDVPVWEWNNTSEVFGDQMPNSDPDGDGVPFALSMRFPGQQASAASGLYYNYQRDYDPSVGRYVQSDPMGLLGGISTFAYAEGDPMSWIDPLGLRGYRSAPGFGRPGGGNSRQRAIYNSAQIRAIQSNSHRSPIYVNGLSPEQVGSAENLAGLVTGLDYTQYCAAELCRDDPEKCSMSDRVNRNWLPSRPTVAQVHARGCRCLEPYYSNPPPVVEPEANGGNYAEYGLMLWKKWLRGRR